MLIELSISVSTTSSKVVERQQLSLDKIVVGRGMTNSAAVVKRIGIKLQPPQVLIEYHRQSQCRVRRIHISNDLAKKVSAIISLSITYSRSSCDSFSA